MEHYFTNKQPLERHTISVTLQGTEYTLTSAKGLFSKDRLDTGTRLLIMESHVPPNSRVLDLGCGIGVVGILLKKRDDSLHITQSDVSDNALTITRENSKHLGVQTKIIKSDVYDSLGEELFNVILTNPPRAAGKKVILRMINEAHNHLVEGGSFQLVAMTNKGGETYSKKMKEAFGNVETIARESGFKVYKSLKA